MDSMLLWSNVSPEQMERVLELVCDCGNWPKPLPCPKPPATSRAAAATKPLRPSILPSSSSCAPSTSANRTRCIYSNKVLMSGAVRSSGRRTARQVQASPYARPNRSAPLAKKPSGWFSGILNWLNPSRPQAQDDEEAEKEDEDEEGADAEKEEQEPNFSARTTQDDRADDLAASSSTPAQALSMRGHQLVNNINKTPNALHIASVNSRGFPPLSSQMLQNDTSRSEGGPSPRVEAYERVSTFLAETKGRPLNEFELQGITSFLADANDSQRDNHVPFRFSASPSTPPRTPLFPSHNTIPFPAFSPSPSPSPSRPLTKNPNGVYRYQGSASSARAPRNRNKHHSPAFGTPGGRRTLKLAVPEVPPPPPGKRRRVESADEGSPIRDEAGRVSPPSSSFEIQEQPADGHAGARPAVNGVPTPAPKVNGVTAPSNHSGATTSRVRSAFPVKPSAPAVPSPLRQAWGQSDSPPNAHRRPDPSPPHAAPAQKQTKTASFLTELLKDEQVKEGRRKEVANPYQSAIPVRVPPKKNVLARNKEREKERVKREQEKKEKEERERKEKAMEELSPAAIIEATVPKGSKRARPPPDLERSTRSNGTAPSMTNGTHALPASLSTSGSTLLPLSRPASQPFGPMHPQPSANGTVVNGTAKRKPAVTVEDGSDEEDVLGHRASPPKKQKRPEKVNGFGHAPPRDFAPPAASDDDIILEEVDVAIPAAEMSAEIVEPPTPSSSFASTTNGFSFGFPSSSGAPAGPSAGKSALPLFGAVKSSAPKEPSKLRFSYQAEKSDTASSASKSPTPAVTFSHLAGAPAQQKGKERQDPKEIARAAAVHELPTYSFEFSSTNAVAGPSNIHAKARDMTKTLSPSSLPTFDLTPKPQAGFNWAAAGIKAPAPASQAAEWSCAVCMLKNPASATDKCGVCDAPRPAQVAAQAPPRGAFNWGAAGVRPPEPGAGGGGAAWTCGTCMLQNPASAKDKCTICDAPR